MYSCDKPYTEDKYNKSRKPQKEMPSFSSTLLDEIYRSIDGGAEDLKPHRENPVRKQSVQRAAKTNIVEEEKETKNFRRACLVEKWILEKGVNEKPISKKSPDSESDNKSSSQDNNDVLFFSSTSSSNSDSSGALSSSDTEFFGPQTEPKVSCFATRPRPKPVRTGPSAHHGKKTNPQEEFSLFGDYQNNEEEKKSRALKLYANLKKMKQPISPGARLSSFINSLFNKSKNVDTDKGFRDSKSPRMTQSATSFSRSCMSKYSPGTREKIRDGTQRTVRFHPVNVIVEPCGQRRIHNEGSDRCGKPPLPIRDRVMEDLKLRKMEKSKKVEGNELKGYNSKTSDDRSVFRKIESVDDNDDDDYDGMSDSSSDLFELDHLSLFGSNRYCEELPVYETTNVRMIR